MSSPPPGGFLQAGVLSPPPSSMTSSLAPAALPHPRHHPLKPGGPKESAFIRYVDQRILQVQRRFAKRGSADPSAHDVKGYKSFSEAGKDMEEILDIVWVSGTRRYTLSVHEELAWREDKH